MGKRRVQPVKGERRMVNSEAKFGGVKRDVFLFGVSGYFQSAKHLSFRFFGSHSCLFDAVLLHGFEFFGIVLV